VPLLVVTTTRPELFDRDPDWGRGPPDRATTVTLAPLSDADTTSLIAALLGRAVARDGAHTTMLGRIGGNPLYAEQVCRMLDDQGLLERDDHTVPARPSTPSGTTSPARWPTASSRERPG
jgi:predicted ATPase